MYVMSMSPTIDEFRHVTVVPHPQNGSRITAPGLVSLTIRSSSAKTGLGPTVQQLNTGNDAERPRPPAR